MDVFTPWFPPWINPARVGRYLTRMHYGLATDPIVSTGHWDGVQWSIGGIKYRIGMGIEFCGLAFDPSRAAECSDAETGEPGMWVPTK